MIERVQIRVDLELRCITRGKLAENAGNAGNEGVFDVFRKTVHIELYLCFPTVELKSERSVGILELTGNFTLSSISSDYCSKADIITLTSIRRWKFSVWLRFEPAVQFLWAMKLRTFPIVVPIGGISLEIEISRFCCKLRNRCVWKVSHCLIHKRLQTQLWK